MKNQVPSKLRQIAQQIEELTPPVTMDEMLTMLGRRGVIVLILILSLPFCLPLHIPGFSTPCGLLIALLGFEMIFFKKIWFPKRIRKRVITLSFWQKVIAKSFRILQKIGKILKPRCRHIVNRKPFVTIHGFIIILLGLFLALPLPIPTTNLGVAWPLMLISISFLESDGFFILVGELLGLGYLVGFFLLCFHLLF
jgi:hypothetical protein